MVAFGDQAGLDFLKAHPVGAVAVVGAGGTLTYGQLLARVPRLGSGLHVFDATASLATLEGLLGVLAVGGVALPLNPAILGEARERIVGGLPPHLDGPGVIVMTSGSSGIPKAALLPLGALLESAARSNRNIPVVPGDRWLLSLPLFHVSGLGIVFRAWLGGGAVAIPANGQSLREAILALRPTHVSVVATQLRRLMDDPEALALLSGMKAILLGGSAIPEELIRAAHVAGLPIHKSYGLTEMCSQVTTTRLGAELEELMTAGYPLAPETVRVAASGEIEVRGATLLRGYVGMDRVYGISDWFATGDLGRFDAKGRLIVLGRKDNMFISGGENIHPEEVERALAGLSGVEQVMVVAVPDVEYGQVGFAFVAMAAGMAFDVEALRAGARAVLPGFKVPKHFHPWPDDLAETGIKPSRAALRARAATKLRLP